MGTLLASDNFDRADSPDLGANWSNDLRAVGIVSNKACRATAHAARTRYTAGAQPPDDQRSGALVSQSGGAAAIDNVGPVIRMAAGGAGYYALASFSAGVYAAVYLCKDNDPSAGNLLATYSGAFTKGDRLEIQAIGTQLNVYRNGSLILGPITDAAYTSGRCGLSLWLQNTNTVTADDWEQWDVGLKTFDGLIPHLASAEKFLDVLVAHQAKVELLIDQILNHEGLLADWLMIDQLLAHEVITQTLFDGVIAHQSNLNIANVAFDQAIAHYSKLNLLLDGVIAHQAGSVKAWTQEVALVDDWVKDAGGADSWTKEAAGTDTWSKD